MQEALELKNEFYEKWLSPSGLALLGVGHNDNDNGILFYAMFMQLCKEFDLINTRDKQHAEHLFSVLQKEPGLLNRRINSESREAHDNYIGAMNISLIHNLDFPKKCVDYGIKHGWNYNNTNPEKWLKETQRQGGEIAFYQVCAGYTPDPFYFIWLCIGILIASFQWSSVVNLAWLRLRTLQMAKQKQSSSFVGIVIDNLEMIFNIIVYFRGGKLRFFKEYFNDTIYYRMARVVYG